MASILRDAGRKTGHCEDRGNPERDPKWIMPDSIV
jgi:hypothetical protein